MLEREAFGNATVVAKLQGFHWVWVDRDHTPEPPKRFHVSAYPSILVLGPRDENVHRWSGFPGLDKFLPQVEEALERHALFAAGKTWDTPTPRPDTICAEAKVTTFPAPSEEIPNGITFCGGKLFLALGNTLYRLDAQRAVEMEAKLPPHVRDLGSDGERLYALAYTWTQGGPVHELDPQTGAVLRSFTTKANEANKYSSGMGVACREVEVWALEGMGKLHRVDPQTGELLQTLPLAQRYVAGLAFDGESFVLGSREAIHLVDPADGKTRRSVPVAYPVRALACHEGKIWALEQPVFGFGREHEQIRVWPQKTVVHVLELSR